MATIYPQTSGSGIPQLLDENEILPGTSFAEKNNEVQPELYSASEPQSFDGPQINGRSTTLTLFSPPQLSTSPLLPSLYQIVNDAFRDGHEKTKITMSGTRLSYDGQLNDELGNNPGTFTYVLYYTGTNNVVATASAKPHAVNLKVANGERIMWKRYAPIAEGKEAWELSTMAVDVTLQRQGLAGYLMKITEDEVKKRYRASGDSGKQLILVITTVKERMFEFYLKRGFKWDYENFYEQGHNGAQVAFHVVFMSKEVDL